MLPLTAWAAATDHIWTLTGSLNGPGSTNEIFLAVDNATEIDSFGIIVHYGSTILTPSNPDTASANFVTLDRAVGITIAASFPGDVANAIQLALEPLTDTITAGSGDILKFIFKVADGASAGDTITLVVTEAETPDSQIIASILLTVTPPPPPVFVDTVPGPRSRPPFTTVPWYVPRRKRRQNPDSLQQPSYRQDACATLLPRVSRGRTVAMLPATGPPIRAGRL